MLVVSSSVMVACSKPPRTGLHLHDAYIKTAVPGRSMTAAYATLHNYESATLCLTGFAAEFADTIELHETQQVGGPNSSRVTMRALPQLCIEPGSSATLAPGGMHLMVMGLKTLPPDNARIVLHTASGRAFDAPFRVQPFNQ